MRDGQSGGKMKTPENFQIRPAGVEDVLIILQLIRDLAAYERALALRDGRRPTVFP